MQGLTPSARTPQNVAGEVETQIQKDVTRTYPEHRKFSNKSVHGAKGRSQLYNVLRAYAAFDQELGYCQGMNFLAGMLLIYLDSEEKAFGSLVLIMKERSLRDMYT